MTVGERIKEKRIEMGMTQDELAKKAGYKSRSSINKIELSRDLPLDKVEQVAKILECSPSYLLGWEEDFSIESAQTDVALSNMEKRVKSYALKLAALSEKDKEMIMQMIDRCENK